MSTSDKLLSRNDISRRQIAYFLWSKIPTSAKENIDLHVASIVELLKNKSHSINISEKESISSAEPVAVNITGIAFESDSFIQSIDDATREIIDNYINQNIKKGYRDYILDKIPFVK